MKHRLVRDERGFTLPEMLVTIMMMILVMFALYSIFDMSLRVFNYSNDKVEAVENARLGMEKMEREIRAAYFYDLPNNKKYLLLDPTLPTLAATTLYSNQITFGNDLNGDSKLSCPISLTDNRCEFISYRLSNTAPYTLLRVNTATPAISPGQPVVEFVNGPEGLTFSYLKPDNSGNLVPTTVPSEVTVVRVKLQISKNGRAQTLTTDINLRNRGF